MVSDAAILMPTSIPASLGIGNRASAFGARLAALLLALCTFLAGCDDLRFPRDPERTLETVLAEGRMTVAVADNRPWAIADGDGPPQGVEADLVRAFAEELGVVIDWRRLGAYSALEGLERGDIDLAIGGFDRKAVVPVAGAAPSYAYYKEAFVIGARAGLANPEDLEGRQVFVPRDLPLAQLVREKGAIPVDEWSEDVPLAVVPEWQLVARDLAATEHVLHHAKHVVAVRQGENAWLMRIERFLRRAAHDMGARLIARAT